MQLVAQSSRSPNLPENNSRGYQLLQYCVDVQQGDSVFDQFFPLNEVNTNQSTFLPRKN